MKTRILCSLLLCALVPGVGAETPAASATGSTESHPTESSPGSYPARNSAPTDFDSFVVVLLVRPDHLPELAAAERDRLQEEHLANIRRLAEEGKIFKAGPVEDYSGRKVRGIFILKTDSLNQAQDWVATDPLIKLGRLRGEYLKWYVEKGSLK